MPPKKNKGNPIVDGVDTSTMTREKLEKFAHDLVAEMERERQQRAFFQLERDKLRIFLEITRKDLGDANMQLRSKELDVELAEEHADIAIVHNTQQMKHLQYELQTRVGEIKDETTMKMNVLQEDHYKQELELLKDKRDIKRQLRESEEKTEMQVEQLQMQHSEHLCQERNRYTQEAEEMKRLHKQQLREYIEESEIRHRMEMFEVEERKKEQLYKLVESHQQSFKEVRNYYNDVTLNNLALISTLKEQMEEMRDHMEKTDKALHLVTAENRRLTEPLKEARAELKDLRKQVDNCGRDRSALKRTLVRADSAETNLGNLKRENEVLNMRCEQLTEERDTLKNGFEEAVMAVQQNTSLKTVVLQRQLEQARAESEKRSVVISQTLKTAGLEPQHSLAQNIENVLRAKNEQCQDLRYELARVCKAHDDLVLTYEAKLLQCGIPLEELGFQPIRTTTALKLGVGPAGLVAKRL